MKHYGYLRSVLAAVCVVGSVAYLCPGQVPSKSLPVAVREDDATSWLRLPPDDFPPEPARIDEADAYEIVASVKDYLASPFCDLSRKSFSRIRPEDALRCTGHYYRCPDGKTPYLVRAAYGNPANGQWTIEHVGRKVHIRHGSLGSTFQAFKSAFVLNLPFEPEEVYVTVSIAQ